MAQHKLGFKSIFFLGINTIIGSGIFLLPGKIHSFAGGWSLWLLLFVTSIVLAIAWCTAQCAALFQRNGGPYLYAREAFGEFVGFEVGIIRWIVGMISWAALAVGLTTGLGTFFPMIQQEPFHSLFLLTLIGSLSLLNWMGMQALNRLSQVIAIIKLLPLLLFIFFGLFTINSSQLATALLSSPTNNSIGEGALTIFYAFGGFDGLVVVAGEMKNPKKDLPVILLSIITICAVIYFLILLVSMGSLGIALGTSVTPIADIADQIFGNAGKWTILVAMLFSMSGINVAASFITPRAATALSQDGLLPAKLAQQGAFGTPGVAIAFTAAITLAIACSGSFTQLVLVTALARFISYTAICSSLLAFQRRYSGVNYRKEPWKLIIPLFALSGIGFMLFLTPLSLVLGALATLVLLSPLYLLQKWLTSRREQAPIWNSE